MTDFTKEKNVLRFSELLEDALCEAKLKSVTFSKLPKGEVLKIKGRAKRIQNETVIQFEYSMTEGRVKHKNVGAPEIASFVTETLECGARQADLTATDLTVTLMVSSKGKVSLVSKKMSQPGEKAPVPAADREKKYILSGEEEFLKYLGISDKNGRVHDKKQAKFRQINRFCEQIRDIMKFLPSDGVLNVCDLCCGKSYLSFAAYFYLTAVAGRTVSMTCVDLKKSVMDFCSETASALGFDGMEFICADITKFEPENAVHLVISLHACDTATDIVLDFAAKHRAMVILSTPCCQHEMFGIMDSPNLEFIAKYSVIKQKLCSAATDALRLAKLEASGYRTDAIEFTDPEDTPKNTLLRGILKKNFDPSSKEAAEKREFYKSAYKFMTGREAPTIAIDSHKEEIND